MAPNGLRLALRRCIAAISIGALFGAGCSTGDESTRSTTTDRASTTSDATTTRPSTSTSTTAARDPDLALRAAVRAFWNLYLELGSGTEPFDPERTRQRLAEITTGKELNRLLAVFSANAAAGYVIRGAIDVAPTVVSIDGTTAKVRDCYDDTTGLYRIADGSRIDTDDPERHQVLMTFVRENGTWKVSAITDRGMGCRV
jgi:hypothetical protein